MLVLAGRRGLRLLLPAAAQAACAQAAWAAQQERGLKMLDMFNEEERMKRKAKIKEEIQKGYFDDFREFRQTKGKAWAAPEKLLAATHAPAFPQMRVLQSDGREISFPLVAAASAASSSSSSSSDGSSSSSSEAASAAGPSSSDGGSSNSSSSSSSAAAAAADGVPAASLVCLAFRAGAQPMIEAWAGPFSEHFQQQPGVALFDLAIVEGWVMRMWPFRQAILRSGARGSSDKYALPCSHLYHFGANDGLRGALQLTNLLTGYVFLVDSAGRLRWRGSGTPSEAELATLLRCTTELLAEPAAAAAAAARRGGNSSSSASAAAA